MASTVDQFKIEFMARLNKKIGEYFNTVVNIDQHYKLQEVIEDTYKELKYEYESKKRWELAFFCSLPELVIDEQDGRFSVHF